MKKSRLLAAVCILAVLISALGLSAGTFSGRSSSWSDVAQVLAGSEYTVGLHRDGTVLYAGKNSSSSQVRALKDWKDVARLELNSQEGCLIGYTSKGKVLLACLEEGYCQWSQADVSGWTDVQQLLLQYDAVAGLRTDGTVAVKAQDPSAYRVSDWKNIKEICYYSGALIGLKTDGSIVATNDDWLEWSGTSRSDWKNIVHLIPYYGLMGLRADGKVIGRDNLGDGSKTWTGVREVFFAPDSLFFLRSDGTVGVELGYQGLPAAAEIESWRNIVDLGFDDTDYVRYLPLGLCADGTVKAVTKSDDGGRYGEWNVGNWTDVKQLYSGTNYTIGLRYDGTLLATGGEFGTAGFVSQLSGWKDIVALSVNDSYEGGHAVGLRRDGTVLAAGDNGEGQCNLK